MASRSSRFDLTTLEGVKAWLRAVVRDYRAGTSPASR
jgi:hypothetical protein